MEDVSTNSITLTINADRTLTVRGEGDFTVAVLVTAALAFAVICIAWQGKRLLPSKKRTRSMEQEE
jgi:hypothetical protein